MNLENRHEPCLSLKDEKNMNSHINEQQKRIRVKSHAVIMTQKENTDPYKVPTNDKSMLKTYGHKTYQNCILLFQIT